MAMMPSSFKGKIYALWSVEYSYLSFDECAEISGYITLGEVADVDVNFSTADASAQAVAIIDEEIEAARAAASVKITALENKRQSYLALPSSVSGDSE